MKEDEREVLAHIIQNIDEQEIFMEFVAKAESIKEAWQIAKIFESKRREFMEQVREYDKTIKEKAKQLENLQDEITQTNKLLQERQKELQKSKSRLAEEVLDQEGSPTDILDIEGLIREFSPLATVKVHVKNGATATARAAQAIYDSNLYALYRRASGRLLKLREYITELELTNNKLSIELRDLFEEDTFKETVLSYAEPYDATQLENSISFNPPKKPPQRPQGGDTQAARLDSMEAFTSQEAYYSPIESNTSKLNLESLDLNEKIERKKQTVEQIFSQLNEVLRDEGIGVQAREALREALRNPK